MDDTFSMKWFSGLTYTLNNFESFMNCSEFFDWGDWDMEENEESVDFLYDKEKNKWIPEEQ